MFAQERQELIVSIVNQDGSVKVKDLSIQFDVTEDCIRKDLASLEKKGLLKKAYGGAVRVRENTHMYNSQDRKNTPNSERVILAKKAMLLIKAEDTLFLDISLTSIELANLLKESTIQVTVITNMIDVLNILNHCSHISLIFIGGSINNERDGFCGTLSSQLIRSFKMDKAFLGVVGVDSFQGVLSTYHIDDGIMKMKVIEQSQKSYVFCEERKFVEDGNYVFGSLSDVTSLIVSNELNNKLKSRIEDYGLTIL